MECTWVNCSDLATIPQYDNDGLLWANLCATHHNLLEETLKDKTKIKEMLFYYIKAQGGAKNRSKTNSI